MGRKLFKRWIFLWAFLLLLGGCGEKEMGYAQKIIKLKGMEGTPMVIAKARDGYYLLTYQMDGVLSGDADHIQPFLYKMGQNLEDVERTPLEEKEFLVTQENDFMISQMQAISEGVVMLKEYDGEEQKYLVTVGEDGRIKANLDLSQLAVFSDKQDISGLTEIQDSLGETASFFLQKSILLKLLSDGNGSIFLVTPHRILQFDEELRPLETIDSEAEIEDAAITKDGNLICVNSEQHDSLDQKIRTQEWECATGKWKEPTYYAMDRMFSTLKLLDGDEKPFYVKTLNGILAPTEDYGFTLLMDFGETDIDSEEMDSLISLGQNDFLGIRYSQDGMKGDIIRYAYTQVAKKENAGRTEIVFGGAFFSSDMEYAVKEYNKKNKKTQIILRDYAKGAGKINPDYEVRLNADFMAGKIDIIDADKIGFDNLVNQGALLDLTPYLNKLSGFSVDDLIPSVRDCFERDGKTYAVAGQCDFATLIGKSKFFQDLKGWTMEDANAFYQKNARSVLINRMDEPGSFWFLTMKSSLSMETTLEEYKMALELCKREKKEDRIDMDLLSADVPVLEYCAHIAPLDLQGMKAMFQEEDLTFVGFPSKDGKGSFLSFDEILAINEKSKEKDEAFAFISQFVKRDYQDYKKSRNVSRYPTRKDCFDEFLNGLVKGDDAYDIYNEIGSEMEYRGARYKVEKLDPKDAEKLRELINGACGIYDYHNQVGRILEEEASPYYLGQKSLDETAGIIKNRVELYWKEN